MRFPLTAAVGLLLASAVQAQDQAWLDEKLQLCATCHGEDGHPIQADYPIIHGQHFYYLYVQLRDYKAGRRANPIMQPIVADLDKEQMQALAQYFSEQAWPAVPHEATAADVATGESVAVAGQCTQCHLGGFVGDSRNPRLAGQQAAYLERTMLELKNKVRLNAPDKGALFRTFSEADLSATASYLAAK